MIPGGTGARAKALLDALAADVRRGPTGDRDEAAWRGTQVLLQTLAGPLVRRYPNADVADAVSTVLVRLVTRPDVLDQVRSRRSPASYLYVMLRNALVDQQRLALPHSDVRVLDDVADPSPSVSTSVELRDLLSHLTADERQLVRWRFMDEVSIGEIATRLSEESGGRPSHAAVYQRLFRVLAKLRRLGGGGVG
jgi:RNA polymerase sigma factor (sigma-70 family)